MRLASALLSLFLGLILSGCTDEPAKDPPVQEESHNYLLPGLDHGLLQSPINILSSQTVAEQHNITLNFDGKINQVENLGHTVQLDFERGNTITVDGKTYEFKQIHFHTPSEHLIDGVTFPMEIHVVNMIPSEEENDPPEYAVLALLYKMGNENEFLDLFIDDIPSEEDEEREVSLNVIKDAVFFKLDPEGDLNSCYMYKGSLTTPPYTETVTWLIIKRIMEASPEQIMHMNQIEGDNARHIQATYDREISE